MKSKMVKVKAVVATGNVDLHKEQFSEDSLIKIAEQSLGLPVLLNFDATKIVGKIIKTEKIESCVIAEIEVDKKYLFSKVKHFVVPGFTSKFGFEVNGVKHYGDIEMVSYGLVIRPADPNVTPIEEIK